MQQSPDRRAALKLSGLAFAAGSLPWWVACTRPGASPPPPARWRSPLERTIESARTQGKPVLVLVADDDHAGVGAALADMLRFASDEQAAWFAACAPVLASREQLEAALGFALEGETCGLLEQGPHGPEWTSLPWSLSVVLGWRESDERAAVRRANLDALHQQLVTGRKLEQLAARAREALGAGAARRIEAALDSSAELSHDELLLAPALVLVHTSRERRIAQLASAVRERFWSAPLPGSRWATGYGCARATVDFLPTDDDGVRADVDAMMNGLPRPPRDERGRPAARPIPERAGFMCGMGHFSIGGERFLLAYVDEP